MYIYFKVRHYVSTWLWRDVRRGIAWSALLASGWRTAVSARAEDLSLTALRLTLKRQNRLSHPPAVKWVPWALSRGVEWPGREADNISPSGAQVNNTQSSTSIFLAPTGIALPPLPFFPDRGVWAFSYQQKNVTSFRASSFKVSVHISETCIDFHCNEASASRAFPFPTFLSLQESDYTNLSQVSLPRILTPLSMMAVSVGMVVISICKSQLSGG
jgi:hypothetical protein